MKTNLIYSLALIAGLAITGTVIAQNKQKKVTSTTNQSTQNYCPNYGTHYTYMNQMHDSSYMRHARGMHSTYMMNHQHMNGTTMYHQHMMNNSGNCNY